MYNNQLNTMLELDKHHEKTKTNCDEECVICNIFTQYVNKYNKTVADATLTRQRIWNARVNGTKYNQNDDAGLTSTTENPSQDILFPKEGCKKLENLVFFDNDGKLRIEDFFKQMETRMVISATPDTMKIAAISTYLKGVIGRIADRYISENNHDYKSFKKEMIEKFANKFARLEDLDQFHLLRHTNFNNFKQFITKFTELADRLQLDEQLMFERLTAQLKPEYKRLLKSNLSITTFAAAESFCYQLESNEVIAQWKLAGLITQSSKDIIQTLDIIF